MTAGEVFLLVVRWIHLVAAAAWVGGSLFYLVVLRPAARRSPETERAVNTAAASEFRALVDTCILVLLATGIILAFNRLTPGDVGVAYVVTLSLKIALTVWMVALVRGRRRRQLFLASYIEAANHRSSGWRRLGRAVSGYNAVVIIGILVFLLSDLLKVLFEMALVR